MKRMKKTGGFTLIELLIVIGLLGALTALILPSLTANREDAIGAVCDYNQAGTLRVLKQFKQITGEYPSGLHNGLQAATGSGVYAMTGLPDYQDCNMGDGSTAAPTQITLSAEQVASLEAAGIDQIAYNSGYHVKDVDTSTVVVQVIDGDETNGWLTDEPAEYTFDGRDINDWEDEDTSTTNDDGIVVCLRVAPTTDWDKTGDGGNNDWTGGNVQIGIDLEGKCPVPVNSVSGDEPDFAYYMAYFKV